MTVFKLFFITSIILGVVLETHSIQKRSCPYPPSSDYGFSYDQCAADGPQFWFKNYPQCYGVRQSPINIDTSCLVKSKYPIDLEVYGGGKITKIDVELKEYSINFVPYFENNKIPTVTGGPLNALEPLVPQPIYSLVGFHLHYGIVDEEGSEHTINGKSYPIELHFVFAKPGVGFAVIGKVFNLVANAPPLPFIDNLAKFIESGLKKATIDVTCPVWAMDFVDSPVFNYAHYNGSLTTPPCSENVTWLLSLNIGQINPKQLAIFRKVLDKNGFPSAPNFRPVQPLNGRKVVLAKAKVKY